MPGDGCDADGYFGTARETMRARFLYQSGGKSGRLKVDRIVEERYKKLRNRALELESGVVCCVYHLSDWALRLLWTRCLGFSYWG